MKSTFEEVDEEIKTFTKEHFNVLEEIFAKHEWTNEEHMNEMFARINATAKASASWNVNAASMMKKILAWIIPHALYELIRWKLIDVLSFVFRTRRTK